MKPGTRRANTKLVISKAMPSRIACALFGAIVTRESGKKELVAGAYQSHEGKQRLAIDKEKL